MGVSMGLQSVRPVWQLAKQYLSLFVPFHRVILCSTLCLLCETQYARFARSANTGQSWMNMGLEPGGFKEVLDSLTGEGVWVELAQSIIVFLFFHFKSQASTFLYVFCNVRRTSLLYSFRRVRDTTQVADAQRRILQNLLLRKPFVLHCQSTRSWM